MSGDELSTSAVALSAWARSVLRCPVYGCELVERIGPDGSPELVSSGGDRVLAYPIRDGIPVLIESDARVVTGE